MASNSQDPFSPIHFYGVISKTNLDSIMIPSKFTVRYGRCLSNPVCLKSPDGKEWKVYWAKCDNNFWFQKGWKEFSTYYSLEAGNLVLFKFEGTSQLGVHIIDKSALEIEYPSSMDASSQEDNLDNLKDDKVAILDKKPPSTEDNLDIGSDDMIQISDEMPQSPKASDNTPLSSSSRPLKKMRSTVTDEDVEMRSFNPQDMLVSMNNEDRQPQATKLEKSEGTTSFDKSKCLNYEKGMKKVLTSVKKNIAFDTNKPYFTMVMHPSYIASNSCLPIPRGFAAKNLEEDCEEVKLQTLDGRIWHANYKFPKIGKGWKQFMLESGLKEGDVCVFEMIGPALFKVHIIKDSEKGNLKVNSCVEQKKKVDSFEKKSIRMQDPPIEKASSSKSVNRRFAVMMTQSHIHGTSCLHVPIEYAKAHLRHTTTQDVLLTVQDKVWEVVYAFRTYNKEQESAQFSWGWKQFCKDNDLKVGDVCEFELTQKFKFQVTIYRGLQ